MGTRNPIDIRDPPCNVQNLGDLVLFKELRIHLICTNSRENSVDEQGVVSLSASSWSSCSRLLDPMQRKVPSLRGANTASHPSLILSEAS